MGAKDLLLGSETLYRVILYFILHPGVAPHFRALQRHVGSGVRPLHAAVERLEAQGLVRSEGEANRRVLRANESHAGWNALRHMVRALADPTDVLREAFSGIPGIEAAFVFGSAASGEMRPESDVDILIVGDEVPRLALGRGTSESSALLGREVNVVRYTRDELARRAAQGNSFVRNVLQGPRRWVKGDDESLLGGAA